MSQTPLDFAKVRERLDAFEFGRLFIEELGWSNPPAARPSTIEVDGAQWSIRTIAHLGGVAVIEVQNSDGAIPDVPAKRKLHRDISKLHHENLLIFVDAARARSEWYWVKRENGKELPRPHEYVRGQPGDIFFAKVAPLLFEISDFDKGPPAVVEVARRLKLGLDVEKVTKKFYGEFQQQHIAFLDLISGISDDRQRRWYASVLLNRLMFIWFLQRKGFIGGDFDYIDHQFAQSEARGKDRFFSEFLKLLFFEGFAKPAEERSEAAKKLLGEIRYLNGGLFLPHTIEQQNPNIDVPDRAFANLFRLFRSYNWNLDDTPGGEPNEINPDVLGYIFEKYINQKAFGAYYTRTEITTYLCERTIHRLVLDKVNTPPDDFVRKLPGKNYDFKSIGELKNGLDSHLCRKLLFEVLPKLSILDPACGSGAFLVAAMKTLIDIYGSVIGQAKVRFANDTNLAAHLAKIDREHPNTAYYIRKAIITDNLYGVDIMEEAVEIAKLRLFLALVASARTAEQLEPLPNIDFNLLPGNSLIGLMRVDEKKFDEQAKLFRKSYREVVEEKNRRVATYRHAASYSKDLRVLRDGIETLRAEARTTLDDILLDQFEELGITYEVSTWDQTKQREGRGKKRALTPDDIRDLEPFHWGYEFDEIVNRRGGFDAIITNPPWDIFKPNSKEFFEQFSSLVSRKKMRIEDFEKEQKTLLDDDDVRSAWLSYLSRFPHQSAWFRFAPEYPNQSGVVDGKRTGTDINLYKLFVERCSRLARVGGTCGLVVPSGVYTDLGATQLRRLLFDSSTVDRILSISNERYIFDGVHHSFRPCLLTFNTAGVTTSFKAAFRINPREAISPSELSGFLHDESQCIDYSLELLRRLSPSSLSVVELKNERELSIARKLAQLNPIGASSDDSCQLKLANEFHMTNDRHLFTRRPTPDALPLFEGKMMDQFEYDPSLAQYWIREKHGRAGLVGRGGDHGELLDYQDFRLALRRIGRNTDSRTLRATILPPRVFASESFHLSAGRILTASQLCYMTGLLNSFVVDYQARQRVAANISMFHVYQLFVPRIDVADHRYLQVARNVARLVCTTPEYDDLARSVGIDNTDMARDDFERSHVRAEIDAILAHAFTLTEQEFGYILGTFPVVPESTKDLALDTFRNWKPPSNDPLVQLIEGGESLRLEFKSSARWDYQRKQVNKDLELIIVKTIAALMNSEGGTLLIGVADDGTVLGLDPDYATIGKKNADAYENWLMTRLLERIGRDRTRLLHVTFRKIEGKEICRIDVERSRRPVFVTEGQNTERLYVRTGNSTRELSVSEALEYRREHFSEKEPAPEAEPVKGDDGASPPPPAKQSRLLRPGDVETRSEPNLGSHGLFRKKNDEPRQPAEASRTPVEDMPVEEILPVIREVVSTAEAVDREEAIREIARRLGAERTGSRIRASIESALNAASRRYIIYSDSGGLRPYCRTIDQYKRDDLKNVLRAVIGRTWTDEDEAIRTAARYLGFRRTGSQIERAFRSAINGGLRQGVLERSGRMLRSSSQS